MSAPITVRLFAGAAEAFGGESARVPSTVGTTVGDVVAVLVANGGPGTADVLGRCSFLVAGVRADGAATPVAPGAQLDVLPPFAGG
ncbi:MoaD/ThiS family protein [Litorihabitans aurantiacus]|uniref:Thiamine biosynthesis protein ThiS n=1 Tax=Litorihabitans aurantiacus TaxID=1930061 RepID=A0AA38CS36_9MICO|nr:MoaD/ThiS family protein [Litorihabitans aurantiacus]GMA33323.1 thiamine biosynthesis protein ThiS [Litorihabitans aurantiacus]